jgi:DNA-binding PucR family transcriptional regulator
LALDGWSGLGDVNVDIGPRHRDDFRMEGGDATVAAELSAVAATVAGHVPELSSEIWALLTHDIPELRGDHILEKLLDASIEENVATLLHVFEHGLVPDRISAPPAAVEYARRLAQRGMSTIALVGAYRVGHGRFLSRCVEELASRTTDAALNAAVTLRLVDISFRYIDRVSEELISVYQQERDRWLLTQTAVRAGRVRELLRGDPVDIATTESALGYRLRRHHLALVAWVDGAVQGSDGLTRLDRLGASAARALNSRGRYLFVPRDESLAWLWIPLGDTRLSDELLPTAFENGDAMIRVAVGAPGYGLHGFRQTHVQAERTQDLALAAKPGARVTTFADVGAIALICADVDAARSWVWGTLGDLVVDDESHARLRNTLQVFLRAGTYTATAEKLALHKNSVQYRIRKAEEALGGRIDDRRADLELALQACQYLGHAVLRPVYSGSGPAS